MCRCCRYLENIYIGQAVSGMLETSEVLEQDKVEGVTVEEWNE